MTKKVKKKVEAPRPTAMIVRRETRADMAESWVREISRQEIEKMLAGTHQAIREISHQLKRLRFDLESLERRSGEFTGMTETETSDLVRKLVKDRVSYEEIHRLVDEVLSTFYGRRPIEHESFRKRLGLPPTNEEPGTVR